MSMFRDKAFQVKVVHTDTPPYRASAQPQESAWTPDRILEFGKEALKTIVIASAVLYGVKVVLDTSQEVVVKKTKSK